MYFTFETFDSSVCNRCDGFISYRGRYRPRLLKVIYHNYTCLFVVLSNNRGSCLAQLLSTSLPDKRYCTITDDHDALCYSPAVGGDLRFCHHGDSEERPRPRHDTTTTTMLTEMKLETLPS
ncbi:hypothetical protein BSL78_22350 [Apostichopus japonicus]|uniref:Uncharacterized protein n=1 Tax=Stichopus japonicus TaxID=307972 RepID=A0A2G8JYJ5_STIJA|nr:hypothetical protein BSL78_22350 [Apostichopus japonicus]